VLKTRRRSRLGAEKWGVGILLPSRLWGLGECRELPQGLGRNPSEKQILCILSITKHFWLQDIVNHDNNVLQAEMEYAIKTGQQARASVTARTNIYDISRTKQTVTVSLATLSSSSSSPAAAAN